MERIVTEKRSFVDEYGRERIFYGVNIVDKRKTARTTSSASISTINCSTR